MNKDKNLDSLTERLNYVLSITGTKKSDLAKSINVKPQIIQFLCSSNTKSSRFTFEIATALGVNTLWLATGEGEIFTANDPEKQFLNTYRKVPIYTIESLTDTIRKKLPINDILFEKYFPLETTSKDQFIIKMPDTSMEPNLPYGAFLFIKPIFDFTKIDDAYVLVFLRQFDTLIVRKLKMELNETFLIPHNTDLFKKIEMNQGTEVLGIVTNCFWQIRN